MKNISCCVTIVTFCLSRCGQLTACWHSDCVCAYLFYLNLISVHVQRDNAHVLVHCEEVSRLENEKRACVCGRERRLFELPDVKFPNVSHGCHYTHKDETLFKHTTHTLGYSLNYESIKPAPCRQHTQFHTLLHRTGCYKKFMQFYVHFA